MFSVPRRLSLVLGMVLLLGMLVPFGTPLQAQTAAITPPQTLEELQSQIETILKEDHVPGVGIVLVSRDQVLWSAGLGVADVATGTPVTSETRFRVGSIAKTLIALSILQQQEAGHLNLDDRLRDRAPELEFTNQWETTNPVRISHLLEHTSGFTDLTLHDYGLELPNISIREGLAETVEARTTRWQPGRYYFYSNVGPMAAAYVVEQVTGQPYDQYVREHFFEPLGMSTAQFFLPDSTRAMVATSYEADGVTVLPLTNPVDWPSGSLSLAPKDMAPLLQLLLNRGRYNDKQLLSPESIERMERPTTVLGAQNGLQTASSLGLFGSINQKFLVHSHDGALEGFLSYFGYFPEPGVGYFLTINSANIDAAQKIDTLTSGYLLRNASPPKQPAAVALQTEQLDQFTGYYQAVPPDPDPVTQTLEGVLGLMKVQRVDDHLELGGVIGTPKPMVALGPNQFRGPDDPVVSMVFSTTPEGDVVLQKGPWMSLRRIPAWAAWARMGGVVLFLIGLVSTLLFAVIWIPRLLLGKLRNTEHVSMRIWPLITTLAFIGMVAILIAPSASLYTVIAVLGKPTFWSVLLWLLSLLFAGASVIGAIVGLRSFRWNVGRWVRWHTTVVSMIYVVAAAYLAASGMIGMMTWR